MSDSKNIPEDRADPEHIWAVHHETHGAIMIGEWADTVRHLGGIEYIRADLAATSAPAEVEGLVDAPISSDDLRELLGAATPGPWNVTAPVDGSPDFRVIRHGPYGFSGCGKYMCVSGQVSEEDASLIALAPQLAAEVLARRADLAAPAAKGDLTEWNREPFPPREIMVQMLTTAIATNWNDDRSDPQTEKRSRAIDRSEAMAMALAYIEQNEAAPSAPAEVEGLVDAVKAILEMRNDIETDISSAHRNRGNGASEWMREDDRDFRKDLSSVLDDMQAALASRPAPTDTPDLPAGAVEALENYQQADMDGVIVKVSRQACEEAATALTAQQAENERLLAERDALAEALRKAEAALSDIGDAEREPGDDLAWCERRAAEAIPIARTALAKLKGEV